MKIYVEHRKISGKFSLPRVMDKLASSGCGVLLFKSLKDEAVRQLSPFGVGLPDSLDIGEREMLVCPDSRVLAAVSLVQRGEQRYLQTIVIYEQDNSRDELLKLFGEISQLESDATKGSVRDAIHTRRLERILSKLSPNGQKLNDPSFQVVLPKLFDSKAREIVREVYNTYSEVLVPAFILKKSEALTRNSEISNNVLNDTALFTKQYGIACQQCEHYVLPLVYESDQAAQTAVVSSKVAECPLCHKGLSVTEVLSVQEIARQGIEQGLWLEYLVYSVVKEKAVAAFAGRIAGLHELDVVAALGEEIILFECKDTTLGHNEPIVTAGKAQAIGASTVFTITTRDIHENVRQAVKELATPRRSFELEQAKEEAAIRSKIVSFLSNIEKTISAKLSDLMNPRGSADS